MKTVLTVLVLVTALQVFGHDACGDHPKFVAWGQAVALPDGEAGPPKNSLEHVQCAADLGFDAIELDIRISKDGVPVLAHDDLLPDGSGRISQSSFADLKQAVIGEWRGKPVRMASLEEALQLNVRPAVIVADMRVRAADGDKVADVVRRNMRAADFVFTAYDLPRAKALQRALPGASVFLKTYDTAPLAAELVDSVADQGLQGLMFQVRHSITEPVGHVVDAARDRGLRTMTFVHIKVWGTERLTALNDAGVDHILTTTRYDDPPRSCTVNARP